MKKDLSHLKEGEKGNWKLQEFEVTGKEWQGFGSRYVPPGKYWKLSHYGSVMMSNTPDEIQDHRDFLRRAEGSVLINGLGLGMCAMGVIDQVDDITIVEIDKDLIDLVNLSHPKITIIHGDAFNYHPGEKRFDAVWHDIWQNICTDNLEEMKRLHRRYGRWTKWQGSWCRGLCEHYKRKR